MSRVLTALSGGVDSAVTAALLMQAGHTVGGATMVLHDSAEAELADARRSAERLGNFTNFTGGRNFSASCRRRLSRRIRRGRRRIPA